MVRAGRILEIKWTVQISKVMYVVLLNSIVTGVFMFILVINFSRQILFFRDTLWNIHPFDKNCLLLNVLNPLKYLFHFLVLAQQGFLNLKKIIKIVLPFSLILKSIVMFAVLKLMASQRSLTVVTGFVTAEKLCWTVTMTANT